MVEVKQEYWDKISEAIVLYIGKGASFSIDSKVARVVERFGKDATTEFMEKIRELIREFMKSDAWKTAPIDQDEDELAAEEFRKKYPHISDAAIEALKWNYSFAHK